MYPEVSWAGVCAIYFTLPLLRVPAAELRPAWSFSASMYSSRKWDRSTSWKWDNPVPQGCCEDRTALWVKVSPARCQNGHPQRAPQKAHAPARPKCSRGQVHSRGEQPCARASSAGAAGVWSFPRTKQPQRSGADPPQDSASPQHFYKKIARAPEPG